MCIYTQSHSITFKTILWILLAHRLCSACVLAQAEFSTLNPRGITGSSGTWWAAASTLAFLFKKQSGQTMSQKTCKKLHVVGKKASSSGAKQSLWFKSHQPSRIKPKYSRVRLYSILYYFPLKLKIFYERWFILIPHFYGVRDFLEKLVKI